MPLELESYLRDIVDLGRKWLADFNARIIQLVSLDQSNNTGAIDVRMDASVLEEISSFKMLGLSFSSKLDYSSYIISITNGAFTHSEKFLSPEVALYLNISTLHPFLKYCCHFWAAASGSCEYNGYLGHFPTPSPKNHPKKISYIFPKKFLPTFLDDC